MEFTQEVDNAGIPIKKSKQDGSSEKPPHIKKFERPNDDSKQYALDQSNRIFGPSKPSPVQKDSVLIKSEKRPFMQKGKEDFEKTNI